MDSEIESILQSARFAPYSGWQSTNPARPAIQQNREEFYEFLPILKQRNRCLQIGLGYPGASHAVWSYVFKEAWTVEFDATCTKGWDDCVILGNSHDPNVVAMCRQHGPFDLLFVDGDKKGLRQDHDNYAPFVSYGGIVAFHDSILQLNSESTLAVHDFMQELKASRFDIKTIGQSLGISYYEKRNEQWDS